jgi:hypothetical protein
MSFLAPAEPVTISGTEYRVLRNSLEAACNDLQNPRDGGKTFQEIVDEIKGKFLVVNLKEAQPDHSRLPLEFATLVERYGANIPAGCHIFDHGKEIAFQPVVDVITQVAEQFEKAVLDPEVIKLASAVRDPAIAPDDKFRALLKVKIIEDLKKSKSISFFEDNLPQVTSNRGTFKEEKLPDFIPFNVKMIIELKNFQQQTRSVLVNPDECTMVTRHGGKNLHFQVLRDKVEQFRQSPQYKNKLMMSLWVLVPKLTKEHLKWEFGTIYMKDRYPYQDGVSLQFKLNEYAKNGKELHPDFVRELIVKEKAKEAAYGGKMYALLPADYILAFEVLQNQKEEEKRK